MLGIEATDDRAAIRRAYAAKLKTTNPEDDPEGFQALRAAYERALSYAAPGSGARLRGARLVVIERDPEPKPEPDAIDLIDLRGEGDSNGEPETDNEADAQAAERRRARRRDWRPADEERADLEPDADPAPNGEQRRERAWRAPDADPEPEFEPELEPEPKPPRRRARAWRPAEPGPEPEPDPEPPPIFDEATEREFDARRTALLEAVRTPAPTAAGLREALKRVLASPVLEQVSRRDEVEQWMAGVILSTLPASDPLVDPAITYFGWDAKRVGPRSRIGDAVLGRRDDLKFLADCRLAGARHRGALEALTSPPKGRRWLLNRITPGLGPRVRTFLDLLRGERPGLLPLLNAEAVDWWGAYAAKPRLGALAIWLLIAGPLVGALGASDNDSRNGQLDPVATAAVTFAVIAAIIGFKLFAVDWPRLRWRTVWSATAPGWVQRGWAPALAVLVLGAALTPPTELTVAGFALAGLPLVAWSLVVGEPDRREYGRAWPGFRWRGPIITFPIAAIVYVAFWGLMRRDAKFPWQARTVFTGLYLVLFWLISLPALPPDGSLQVTGPLLATIVAVSAGSGSLQGWWAFELPSRGRLMGLLALAAMTVVALALLVAARTEPAARLPAAALIGICALAHKTPAFRLPDEAALVRDIAMRYGGVILAIEASDWRELAPGPGAVLWGLIIGGIGGWRLMQIFSTRPKSEWRSTALRIGDTLARYGWLVLIPIFAIWHTPRDVVWSFSAGLWVLGGVGVTLAGLASTPWDKRVV